MRRILTLLAVLLLCVGVSYAQSSKANIANTPHDMSLASGTTGCAICHAPHNSASTLNTVLLWRPAAPTAPAATTFPTYTGSQINTAPTDLAAPALATDVETGSYLCLSCHDGATAAVNFGVGGVLNGATWPGGTLSDGTTVPQQPSFARGTTVVSAADGDADLTNDHPVNFTYPPDASPVPGFALLSAAQTAGFKFFGTTTDSMQCATCHNPHDQNLTGPKFFLRTSATTTVGFCTQCHL